jgi:hypothetical protein
MLRRSITGQLKPRGAFIDTTIMATHFQVQGNALSGFSQRTITAGSLAVA